jgi:DUF1365 family protein
VKSAIYHGQVYHRRFGERQHTLKYRVFYVLLDLDELVALDRVSRLFGVNRPSWFSFREADHGDGTDTFRDWCEGVLHEAGITGAGATFQVLTTPRVLGYGFNPISVVYCRRADGSIGAMIYEVNNTFGERIAYAVPVARASGRIRQRCEKSMFVSPFYDLEGTYEFNMSEPLDAIDLAIDYHCNGERQLRAVFRGQRREFTRGELVKLALGFPAASVKIIVGIHYEALKLWLKGVPLVRHRRSNTKLSIGTEI